MQKIAEIAHPPVSDHLVFNLWRYTDGRTAIKSVEVVDKGCRLRVSLPGETSGKNVFAQKMLENLRYLMTKCADVRGLLSMPDMTVTIGDLVLAGCRVMISAAKNGIESVIIRFSNYFGNLTNLFHADFKHRDTFASEGVDRAVDALEKIYLPLRNFSKFLEEKMQDPTEQLDKSQEGQFLQKVNDQIHELDFYMDMITHYVASQAKLVEEAAAEPQTTENRASAALPGVYL